MAAAAADLLTAPLQLPLIVAVGIGELRQWTKHESPVTRADP
jgi:hypothetical protein